MNRLFNTLFVMAFTAAMTITSAVAQQDVAQQDKDTNGTAMSSKELGRNHRIGQNFRKEGGRRWTGRS